MANKGENDYNRALWDSLIPNANLEKHTKAEVAAHIRKMMNYKKARGLEDSQQRKNAVAREKAEVERLRVLGVNINNYREARLNAVANGRLLDFNKEYAKVLKVGNKPLIPNSSSTRARRRGAAEARLAAAARQAHDAEWENLKRRGLTALRPGARAMPQPEGEVVVVGDGLYNFFRRGDENNANVPLRAPLGYQHAWLPRADLVGAEELLAHLALRPAARADLGGLVAPPARADLGGLVAPPPARAPAAWAAALGEDPEWMQDLQREYVAAQDAAAALRNRNNGLGNNPLNAINGFVLNRNNGLGKNPLSAINTSVLVKRGRFSRKTRKSRRRN